MIFRFLFIAFLLFSTTAFAQPRNVYLLDMTNRNGEANTGNLFSANQLLIIAGLDFSVSTDLNTAIQSGFLVLSSNTETNSFTAAERDSLTAFVNRGGIIVAPSVKDSLLFPLFGVTDYDYSTTRREMNWVSDPGNQAFRWIDDPYELSLKLGDTSYAAVIGTRGYSASNSTVMALFEDQSAAVIRKQTGNGYTYLLGLAWKDLVLRNEQALHYDAARSYSNGFEPQTDVFALFIRGVYLQHTPHAVWKHTSGMNSVSSLIITHDVDATTGVGMMNDFAGYEKSNNIRATYFITTHYMHDSLAKDFYTNYTDTMHILYNTGMEIASHSVSHVPDFDNEMIVPLGTCGYTQSSYQPFWNGSFSSGVTVCGETEVSKNLLETELGVTVRAFRSGYLAYNKNLIVSLENNGYSYNCTHSANNVLTAFPFQAHYGLSMDSAVSSIYEIPNTISDVFQSNPISENNYPDKVNSWHDAYFRNSQNNALTCLMIHPNRYWKIAAEQDLIRRLTTGTRIVTVNEYGDYWKARETVVYSSNLVGDSILYITIDSSSLPLPYEISFVVAGGQTLQQVIIQDQSGTIIQMLQSDWTGNDLIIHSRTFSETYSNFDYVGGQDANAGNPYPNPFVESATIELDLMQAAEVTIQIFDMTGRKVQQQSLGIVNVGHHDLLIPRANLDAGVYVYQILIGEEKRTGKLIVEQNR
jgi:peptidoglycan/xylan/chitin deacetylase (PgdA/CDA1 family)